MLQFTSTTKNFRKTLFFRVRSCKRGIWDIYISNKQLQLTIKYEEKIKGDIYYVDTNKKVYKNIFTIYF